MIITIQLVRVKLHQEAPLVIDGSPKLLMLGEGLIGSTTIDRLYHETNPLRPESCLSAYDLVAQGLRPRLRSPRLRDRIRGWRPRDKRK